MMSSNLTSKIVVGLGLAAAFGIGVSIFAVQARQEQESQFALNAPAPAMADPTGQNATDTTVPAQSAAAQTPTDLTATPSSALSAAPAVVAPTSPTTTNAAKGNAGTSGSDESKPAKSKRANQADRQVAKTRNTVDAPATHVAFAAISNASDSGESASNNPDIATSDKALALAPAPPSNDTTSAATAGTTADTQQAPAQTAQEGATSAGPAATSSDPIPSDSQITAHVKSEIATAAPNSNIDVTTANGVVALAGSVPSQDAVVQAKQAAQRVAGVKYVDATALMVSNQ
jgi:hyperosmotically inducible protein